MDSNPTLPPVLTPFQLWAVTNRDHLRTIHHMSVSKQTAHERSCGICRAGLTIAIACCSTLELAAAMDESRRQATQLYARRRERRHIHTANFEAIVPLTSKKPPTSSGFRDPLVYKSPNPKLGLVQE